MPKGIWNRLFSWRLQDHNELNPQRVEFVSKLRLNRSDGWAALELFLKNRSQASVWVEDATLILTELDTSSHIALPSGQARHQILQDIQPNDELSVSVAEAIYDAAGRPQGLYSSLVFTNIRYRALNQWCGVQLETCRIEMDALTAVDLHRVRRYDKRMKNVNGLFDLTTNQHKD
jgi:hypothetical protein